MMAAFDRPIRNEIENKRKKNDFQNKFEKIFDPTASMKNLTIFDVFFSKKRRPSSSRYCRQPRSFFFLSFLFSRLDERCLSNKNEGRW